LRTSRRLDSVEWPFTSSACLLSAAGAIISGGKGAAKDKVEALERAGAFVAKSPAQIGPLMLKAMQDAGLA
jgi:succinyl-CoA synthetase alpha subunit